MNISLYINSSQSDFAQVKSLLERLTEAGYSITQVQKVCDYVVSFFSTAYLADKESVLELTYAACSLRKEFILVALEDGLALPAELEMLAAKHGLVSPKELENNIALRVAEPECSFIDYPITQKYVLKPFEADPIEGADYAFVSYAHTDAQQVYDHIKPLYEQGWKLWYDEGIKISNRYIADIAGALKHCKAFLLFVTERSLNRPFVINFELAYAKKLGIPIIPVLMENVSSLPIEIAGMKLAPPEVAGVFLAESLINIGERVAVSPKDKKGEEYELKNIKPMKNFMFEIIDNEIHITRYTGSVLSFSYIPWRHCGLKIKSIEECAFLSQSFGWEIFQRMSLPMLMLFVLYILAASIFQHLNMWWLWKDLILVAIFILVGIVGGIMAGLLSFKGAYLIPFPLRPYIRAAYLQKKCVLQEKTDKKTQKKNPIKIATRSAYLIYQADSTVEKIIQPLLEDGFLLQGMQTQTETSSDDIVILAFITKELLSDEAKLQFLQKAYSKGNTIIAVYLDVLPNQLQTNYATTIGQLEGILWNNQKQEECYYQLQKALAENSCYENPFSAFSYSLRKEGIVLTRYRGYKRELAIPRRFPDKKKYVTEIGIPPQEYNYVLNDGKETGCFSNASLVKVIIPDSITMIREYAFSRCVSLKQIVIPNSVLDIKGWAFQYSGIEYIDFPDEITKICSCTCMNCRELTKVKLPNKLKKIRDHAFSGCDALKEIVIPDGVKTIDYGAFNRCTSLTGITIPKSVFRIDKNVFERCPKLTIHTPTGSYAEKYAQKRGIPYKTYTLEEWDNYKHCESTCNAIIKWNGIDYKSAKTPTLTAEEFLVNLKPF